MLNGIPCGRENPLCEARTSRWMSGVAEKESENERGCDFGRHSFVVKYKMFRRRPSASYSALHLPEHPPSLQSTASAEMPRMMFSNRFEGMGLFGVPPTPTYSLSIFAFIASLTSPGLRSLGAAGAGGS